jgi:hypothetical protein
MLPVYWRTIPATGTTMAEFGPTAQKGSGSAWSDVGVGVVCGLIAVPLCDASWHAIVAEHETINGIIGLAFGLPIGIAGFTFHWWKTRWTGGKAWLLRQANRWWPAAILFAFVYVAGPAIYQRAVGTNSRPIGKVVWNFDSAAGGGGWFLGMFKTNQQEIRVLGFQAHGKNITKDPIHELKGWMRSDITNVEKQIYIMGQDNDESQLPVCTMRIPTAYDETYGIPPFADFDVVTFPFVGYAANDGISTSVFLSTVAPFTVHLEYDGAVVDHQFSKAEVQKQVDLFGDMLSLHNVPRVIRKQNAAKPKLRALSLSPVTNATPAPILPPLEHVTPDEQFDMSPTGTMVPRPR